MLTHGVAYWNGLKLFEAHRVHCASFPQGILSLFKLAKRCKVVVFPPLPISLVTPTVAGLAF